MLSEMRWCRRPRSPASASWCSPLAFWLMTKLSPFSIRKEIEEDQNIALGIIIAGVIIGIALIISAAISG